MPNDGCCHQKRYDHVEDHIYREGKSQEVSAEAGFHLNSGGQHQDGENQQGPVTDSGLRFLFHRPKVSVEFADGPVGACLNALIAADAVGRIPGNGVLVDTQDVHLAQNTLRAGTHALPAGLADMGIDKDMLRLVLGRAIGWISFHGRKGTAPPCNKTITIVKKSLAGADSAQRYWSDAKIRRQIVLRNSGHHLRMLLQEQLVSFLRRVFDAG